MSYREVLDMLESALKDADSLEEAFDQSTNAMKELEVTRKAAIKSGLSFSDDLYDEAREKFESGDYEGANAVATSSNQKLEACHLGFEDLVNLFEMLETFEMKHTIEFNSFARSIFLDSFRHKLIKICLTSD